MNSTLGVRPAVHRSAGHRPAAAGGATSPHATLHMTDLRTR